MMVRLYRILEVKMEEKGEKEAQRGKEEIVKENQERKKSENLENVNGKKRANQGRKKERKETKKNYHINKSRKLYLNVLFHRLMKVMTID